MKEYVTLTTWREVDSVGSIFSLASDRAPPTCSKSNLKLSCKYGIVLSGMSLNLGLQAGSFTRQLFTQDEIRLNVALYRRRLPKRRDQQAAKFSKGVEGEASVPNSFREKLKSNPAYQRLKQSTWQHNYKPSGNVLQS